MHTNHKREDPLIDMGYEVRDINYSALGKTAFFFFGFAFLSFIVVGVWFYWAQPQTNSVLDPKKPMPTMKIQSNIAVRADIETLRQHETAVLQNGGANPDGTARIPIDKAMDILAKRGLPHTETAVSAVSPGNTIKQNALQPGATPPPAIAGPIGGATTP